jgi:uncharacterized protein (DUF1697 family)
LSRYVALFDSIRVGGRRLTMAELRAAFEAEGLSNVENVVASGNVLFDHPERPDEGLEEKLRLLMRARFGMGGVVLVRSPSTLAAAIAENAFAANGGEEDFVHTLFLDGAVDPDAFARMQANRRGAEQIAMGDRALHIDYVSGAAEAKLVATFVERRLGLRGTARSLRTVKRILAKLNEV